MLCRYDACTAGCMCRVVIPAGVELYKEGELATRVYWLCEGCVAISRRDNAGSLRIANIAEPGELLGFDSLETVSFYPATVTTLESTSLCAMPRSQVITALQNDGSMLLQVLKGLCSRLNRVESCLEQAG